MSWLFGDTPTDDQVDRCSPRWVTAVHEAGHAVAVRRQGGRVTRARVWGSHGGRVEGTVDGALADGVQAAAGRIAARHIAGRTGGWDGNDAAHVRRCAREAGVSVGELERRAARLVRSHRGEIEQAARRLYRSGSL